MTTVLSVIGGLLVVLGVWLGYEALITPVDVGGTVNLSLIQAQTITFALAATAFMAGSVFMVGASLYYALTRPRG